MVDSPLLTPLYHWHQAQGAKLVPFAGWQMPLQYAGIVAEHLHTRSAVSLFDVSHMGQLLLTGQGADRALEQLLPGDIVGLAEGRMRYSRLTLSNGGILDDLMVVRLPSQEAESQEAASRLHLVINAARRQVVVGPREALATRRIVLRDLNWLDDQDLTEAPRPALARVRSTRQPVRAEVRRVGDRVEVELLAFEEGVAPGQACVLYDAVAPDRMLGGGWIVRGEAAFAA
jgi:aminomethyltransferase